MDRSRRTQLNKRGRSHNEPPIKHKQKSSSSLVFPLLLFAAILAILILIFPKEPTISASVTVATNDGKVVSIKRSDLFMGLRISEAMSVNKAAVPDDMGNYSDFVEIWNSTDHSINLQNVGLSDKGNRIRFIFPAINLPADGRVIVFCSGINRSEAGKTLHARFKLSAASETIYLFDPNALLIDKVTLPIMNADASYSLLEDGTYEIVSYFSPGYPNTLEGHQSYRNENYLQNGSLILNELVAKAKSNLLPDEDGDLSDWLELRNLSDKPISLKGIFLSNKESKPLKWKFPDEAVIPANGYYVVFCSGKDREPGSKGIPHTNFRISSERSTLLLSDNYGRLLDRVSIDNLMTDKSFGRNERGDWQVFNVPTPGLPNNEYGSHVSDRIFRANNHTGVQIVEVVASNNAISIVKGQPNTDYVKLYNSSDKICNLAGYGLSDSIKRTRKWQFPVGVTINPGAYLTVFLDGKPEKTGGGLLHTNFKLRRAGGETICFSTSDGIILDKIDLPLIPTDIAYGRAADRDGFFYFSQPSPNGPNSNTAFKGFTESPVFSVEGGLFTTPVKITLTVPERSQVYYTTDGSIPTRNHTLYTGETLTMVFTGVLRARAFSFDERYLPSDIVTQSYFINALHTLPIISITIDPVELFSDVNGLFTPGPNIDKSKGIPFRNAIYRQFGKIPRPCHAEYYSLDNETIFHQGLEVSLSGGFSLDIPQKSLKFRAKSLYGAKYINASLFPDRPFNQYKSFTLRMGGNDGLWTRLADGFQSRLVDELGTTVIHQAWKPVVVYINGIYWGHYNLRERKDKYFIAQNEGKSFDEAKNMDLVKGSGKAKYGTAKEYNDLIAKARTLSPATKPDDLKYITDRVDVDNMLDFFAIEMFFGNSDIGNILIYKFKEPGAKFRWLLYDLDYGLFRSTFDSPKSYLKASGMGQDNVNNVILVKLLENAEIRDLFLRKLGRIFQLFTTEFMTAKLDEMVALLEPEMPLHFARWAEFTDKTIIAEVPNTPEAGLRYWQQRITRMRSETLILRPPRLYEMIQTQFKLTNDQMLHYFGIKPPMPVT